MLFFSAYLRRFQLVSRFLQLGMRNQGAVESFKPSVINTHGFLNVFWTFILFY